MSYRKRKDGLLAGTDIDPDLAKILAVSQRPLAAAAFAEPASLRRGRPGRRGAWWRAPTTRSTLRRFGYQRAGMKQIELDSSHLVMLSHPKVVADLIREVLRSLDS